LVIALVAGVAISLIGVLAGAWWRTFPASLLIGAAVAPARLALTAGALAGLLGWGLLLAAEPARYGLGPTAESLAASMGFTHEAPVPVVLRCLVGLLLGVSGAWLASTIRSLAVASTR
jgi:hypothetical protein